VVPILLTCRGIWYSWPALLLAKNDMMKQII
jgi:hypothetical protein